MFKYDYYEKAFWGGKKRGGTVNKTKVIFDVFFREKPAMMLVELKNAQSQVYASVLAKQIDCTYSHVVKILQEMQKAELINFKKEGRLKLLELTKKGREIARNIESIKTMLWVFFYFKRMIDVNGGWLPAS